MKWILAAACLAAFSAEAFAESGTTASETVGRSVFADLEALGFDLGKFRPDYAGRFPYRVN